MLSWLHRLFNNDTDTVLPLPVRYDGTIVVPGDHDWHSADIARRYNTPQFLVRLPDGRLGMKVPPVFRSEEEATAAGYTRGPIVASGMYCMADDSAVPYFG